MAHYTLDLGWYLVGRTDGLIDPFFAKVQSDGQGGKEVVHNVDRRLVELAIRGRVDDWWWHLMDPGDCLPADFTNYPSSLPEEPDGA